MVSTALPSAGTDVGGELPRNASSPSTKTETAAAPGGVAATDDTTARWCHAVSATKAVGRDATYMAFDDDTYRRLRGMSMAIPLGDGPPSVVTSPFGRTRRT